MTGSRTTRWYWWLGGAALLSALSFTPLVIPAGTAAPTFLGMPRTLWLGILVTGMLVVLTYLAARDAPDESDKGQAR